MYAINLVLASSNTKHGNVNCMTAEYFISIRL